MHVSNTRCFGINDTIVALCFAKIAENKDIAKHLAWKSKFFAPHMYVHMDTTLSLSLHFFLFTKQQNSMTPQQYSKKTAKATFLIKQNTL